MPKNILVLTPRLPYPLIGGDKLRIFNICDFLYENDYRLTLVSFVQNKNEAEIAKNHEAHKIFAKVLTVRMSKYRSYLHSILGSLAARPLQLGYFWSKEMRELVLKEISTGEYDTVLLHLIRMAPYVIGKKLRKVLEMTDAISLNYSRSRGKKKIASFGWLLGFEEKRVRRYEKRCLKEFEVVIVASHVDKDYLSNLDKRSASKIFVVPNGVSEEFINIVPAKYDLDLIIFIGNLRSYQNQDAVFYFLGEIYPLIKREVPSVKYRIIGAAPPLKLLRCNGKNGIEVTGEVDNIISYAEQAAVSVAPIRVGAGIQNKVLESMALGVPVVTTSVAAEGLPHAKPGEHFLVCDTPKEFADAVCRVLKDKSCREKLSSNGKNLVMDHYRWPRCLGKYLEIV